MVGIGVPEIKKLELVDHFAFLQDQGSLLCHDILTHPISLSSPLKIHLSPVTDSVVTVRLSMKAQIGGCQIMDLDLGPLHSGSADFTSMFIVRANRITGMVQPVMIPTSNQCHLDIIGPAETLRLNSL